MKEAAKINEIINSIYPVSSASLATITAAMEIDDYELGTDIVKVQKKNSKEYFVLEGICASYLTNPEGDEVILSFFPEGSVLSPFTTRTSNGFSILNFKALTKVKLACVDALFFEKLIVENLEIREFANTVLRNELKRKVEKEIGLASLSAKERLINLRQEYPFLENIIPHPYIASYIGITNVSMSRLRKEIR